MGGWLADPRLIDAILLLILAEAIVLLAVRRAIHLLPTLASGAALLVALRGALAGAEASWINAALVLAAAAHAVDLGLRLRGGR
ncbi:MAG: hypothetical protein SNJ73_08005 [Acetobacteraceae bacterium]